MFQLLESWPPTNQLMAAGADLTLKIEPQIAQNRLRIAHNRSESLKIAQILLEIGSKGSKPSHFELLKQLFGNTQQWMRTLKHPFSNPKTVFWKSNIIIKDCETIVLDSGMAISKLKRSLTN